jgi:hypothetical protein
LLWGVTSSLIYTIGGSFIKGMGYKIFFLGPLGVSRDYCHIEKKRFGLYYKTLVTLGSVGGEG